MTIVPRTGPLSASSALATTSWYQRGKSSAWGVSTGALPLPAMRRHYWPHSRALGPCYRVAIEAADLGDVLGRLVHVVALLVEQRASIAFGLFGGAGLGPLLRGLDAVGDDDLAHSTSASTISSSGTTLTTLPLTNRWPRRRPAAMPTSASRASPGPFTTQPMTATWIGSDSASSARLGLAPRP